MNERETFSRREWLKGIVAGAVVAGAGGLAEGLLSDAAAAEAQKLIDEKKDFSARALGYLHDGTKTKRADPKQNCGNCKQFKKVMVVDGVDAGKCSLLSKGLVKSTGWCRSYVKDEALYKKS